MIAALGACLLLAAAPRAPVVSPWTTSGPSAPGVTLVLVDPRTTDTVYALADARLFKSVDGGVAWRSIAPSKGTDDDNVYSFAVDPSRPDTLFAGRSFGLVRSDDGGATWVSRFDFHPPFESGSVEEIAVAPSRAGTLYFHTGEALYRSDDAGDHTSRLSGPWPLGSVLGTMAVDPASPDTLFVAVLGLGVFKTFDGGSRWVSGGLGLSGDVSLIVIHPLERSVVYAVSTEGLHKSVDGGRTWSWADPPDALVSALAIDPEHPETLLAGSTRVHRSTDGGSSWTTHPIGHPSAGPSLKVSSLAISAGGGEIAYAGTSAEGFFRSGDGGTTWEARDRGLPGLDVGEIAVGGSAPGTVYALGRSSRSRVYRRAGTRWREITPVGWESFYAAPAALALDPTDAATVYAGFASCIIRFGCYGFLSKSADSGESWQRILAGAVTDVQVDPRHPETIYASLIIQAPSPMPDPHILLQKSSDGGTTWELLSFPSTRSPRLLLDPAHDGTIYAATSEGVFKSSDGGATWLEASSGLPELGATALAIDAPGETLFAATEVGVFRSSDGGATWTFPVLTDRISAIFVDPMDPAAVYAGTPSGLMRSLDGGFTWETWNDPELPHVLALAMDLAATTLYAGTARGVFERRVRRPTHAIPSR